MKHYVLHLNHYIPVLSRLMTEDGRCGQNLLIFNNDMTLPTMWCLHSDGNKSSVHQTNMEMAQP
jgi:hypothetical protein